MAERWLVGAVEALLFTAGEPVAPRVLAEALVDAEVTEEAVESALEHLATTLRERGSGLELAKVAGGYQLRTAQRYAEAIIRLRGGRPQRLSRAALEVLTVVAYEQPVARHEVDALRGVDSGGVLRHLLDRELVRVTGRRDMPGRPMEYGTTKAFLELFGLERLSDLPALRDLEELGAALDDED